MSKQNKQLVLYYRSIRANLPCPWRLKQKILGEIKGSINNFLSEHPDAQLVDIEQQFGTPEQITASYLDEMDPNKLASQLKISKRIITTVSAGIIAALVMFGLTLGIMLWDYHKDSNGYIEIIPGTPTIVEED